MGRFAKKIVILYCVLLASWLPVSVVAASIDCLFHEDSPVTNKTVSEHMHVSFADLSDLDLGISMDSEDHTGPDSGCSTHLIVAAVDVDGVDDVNAWIHFYSKDTNSYQLTAVLLPRDIRPPISIRT